MLLNRSTACFHFFLVREMDRMTNDKAAMREHLAQFLGLEVQPKGFLSGQPDKYKLPNGKIILTTDWKPDENHEQCHRALDTFDRYIARKLSGDTHDVEIWAEPDDSWHSGDALEKSFCEAACVAMCRASGYEGEV